MQSRLAHLVSSFAAAFERRPDMGGEIAESALELLTIDYPAEQQSSDELTDIGENFGLNDFEIELLVIAGAVDIDVRFGVLAGLLLGNSDKWRPSLGLALELCGVPSASADARRCLGPGAPLRRFSLLRSDGDGPVLLRELSVPGRVLAQLLGNADVDGVVEPMLVDVPARHDEVAHRIARGLSAGVGLVHVRGTAGTSGLASALGGFSFLAGDAIVADLSRRRTSDELPDALRSALREAGLRGAGLVVTPGAGKMTGDSAVAALLEHAPVSVAVVDDEPWETDWLRVPALAVTATALGLDEREELWTKGLDDGVTTDMHADEWRDLIRLRVTPEQALLGMRAATLAAATDGDPVDAAVLHRQARAHGSARLQAAAVRTEPGVKTADLVLAPATRERVDSLVSWARHRELVLGDRHLTGKGSKGRGVTALFAGPPGTGKTLAAEAVAGDLGLDLYTVDLPSVVDRYIGETEKRLEALISEAENLNVVLFFDEADSLFGSRAAVRDARDRYANQEVSYLLQRIERFEGLVILATNLAGNVDAAFTRRLHHVITFGIPDRTTRRALWQTHLAEVRLLDDADPVDIDWLAAEVESTGGEVRNIVLGAAFAATDEAMGMRHVVGAVEREMAKLGRRFTTPHR